MIRSVLALAVLAAGLALSGCAAMGGAALGAVGEQVQGPAIVAMEAGVAADFDRATVRVEQGVSDEEAVDIYQRARVAMSTLSIARLAYDATIGGDAPVNVQRQVEAARGATNEAFVELAQRLAERLASVPPT